MFVPTDKSAAPLLGKRKRPCGRCRQSSQQHSDRGTPSTCHHCLDPVTGYDTASVQPTMLDEAILQPPSLGTAPPQRTSSCHSHASPASQCLSVASQHTASYDGSQGRLLPQRRPNGSETGPAEGRTMPSTTSYFPGGNPEVNGYSGPSPVDISLPAAASFFGTYFNVIHPQYPFLDIKSCTEYYVQWRERGANATLVGWPAFFVNMIFAIGSLIESNSDNSPYAQFQNLKSRAQAEQSIMIDSASTPLIRLQAMLLSAMFALHAESTWRIAHVSGAIMKFASLHRFHRLKKSSSDPDSIMSIRAWSSAYVLDRAISSALGTPVSLPDMYITTPLFEATVEGECQLPWLADYQPVGATAYPDLKTFAHVCRIRSIQSLLMHLVERDESEEGAPLALDLEMHLLKSLREWEDPDVIASHSEQSTYGYQSPLWLQHIGHLTRLSICIINRSKIFSSQADLALQASCAACTSFRDIQKRRQIGQPWLIVVSQFRAAVTLWYVVWARGIPVPREASDAVRDCSAVLAIFADRWLKAEYYRDCFELLAVSIPRSQPSGFLPSDTRQRLMELVVLLENSGIHRTTSRMLREIGAERESVPE